MLLPRSGLRLRNGYDIPGSPSVLLINFRIAYDPPE
jgi:hypothetical protein